MSMKRIFDITFSGIGLILLSPILIIIALLIYLNDKGSVFFIQERVGKNGKIFNLIKFRSMRIAESSTMKAFKPGDTSRITRIGRILRKSKIDEIPQMINIIKGDMSFVGPRPEVKAWTDIYPERWKFILTVQPGITDNASIEYRNEEILLNECSDPDVFYREVILPKKLTLYEDYVRNHSFIKDIGLIVKTFYFILFKPFSNR